MGIEVLIRRKIIQEKEKLVAPLMLELRSIARAQPGYVSSEFLRCIDPPDETEYLIRSTWDHIADWKNWFQSEARKAIQEKIDAITEVETEYRIYEPLVDGILEKPTPSQSACNC